MEVEFICELIRGIRLIHKFNHTQKCVVNVSQIQRHVKMRSNANDLSLFVCVMSQKRLCYVTTQCVRILKRLQRALKKSIYVSSTSFLPSQFNQQFQSSHNYISTIYNLTELVLRRN
jgi:hypothetical protein